jgi:hypothetical protein
MQAVCADRRWAEAQEDPEGEALVVALVAEYLDRRLRIARVLVRLQDRGTFRLSACSSIVDYARRLGIPAAEARAIVDLGRTLDECVPVAAAGEGPAPADAPVVATVEDRVRAGRLTVENAAFVGRLYAKPGCVRAEDDWFRCAETLTVPELRRRVNERIEEVAQGVPEVVALSMHVTRTAREDFHRARVIASRSAGLILTEGQTLTLLVREYLDLHDDACRGARDRRVGPTSEAPDRRYIPAAVKRAVLERSGDRCEVPNCTHRTFLEFAHRRPHACGGDREEQNLLRLCHAHHVQFDADVLLFAGWRDGRPTFRNARGEDLRSNAPRVPPQTAPPVEGVDDARPLAGAAPLQVSERPPPPWESEPREPRSRTCVRWPASDRSSSRR